MAIGRYHLVGPGLPAIMGQDFASQSTMDLEVSTERLACKFYCSATATVTHVDMYLTVVGTPVNQLTLEIQTDSSDAPSGSLAGGSSPTAAFAGPSTSGFSGLQALAASASLTAGTYYWLVLKVDSSTTLNASNEYRSAGQTASWRPMLEKLRHFNGTDWTTTAAVNQLGIFCLKTSTDYVSSAAIDGAVARSSQTDVFSTNRQGMKFTTGAKLKVMGAIYRMNKAGSPANLDIKVYEGSTEKQSQTVTAADITSGSLHTVWFASPVILASDTACYITFGQTADGGDGTNDYDLYSTPISSTHIAAMLPSTIRMVAGTGNDPTAFTAVSTELPHVALLIDDQATELDETAGGGTTFIFQCGE